MDTKRTSKRLSKRDSNSAQLQMKRDSQRQSLYERSSLQLFKPSTKLKNDWTNSYTAKFQQLWNDHFLSILEDVTHSKMPSKSLINPFEHKPKRSSSKKLHKSSTKSSRASSAFRAVPQKGYALSKYISTHTDTTAIIYMNIFRDFPILLYSICKSLQFGLMNLCLFKDAEKNKESDIFSFYFSISFQTQHSKHYMLYLKFMDDAVMKLKNGSEIRSKQVQIQCDYEYGEINKIINNASNKKSKMRIGLPSHLLAVVFGYIRPSKWLALYSYKEKETDDDFEIVETDKFGKQYFNRSNIEWVVNYFSLESWHFRRLFKILILFLDTKEVSEYIQKEKDYNQKWREWQEAQQDLNREYMKSQIIESEEDSL